MSSVAAPARMGPPWLRMASFGLALLGCVVLPFALWGDGFDQQAPLWLQAQHARTGLAFIGLTLLVLDVVLPVPSSVVAVALCWGLGPWLGGLTVASGVFLAFVAGYGLGRLLPESRLRGWIGPRLWDSTRTQARERALWWIVLARPLPVLAELSAVMAGVWRVPPARAFAHAAAASIVVGALYGASAWVGAQAPSTVLLVIAMSALPAAMWALHRRLLQRLLPERGVRGRTPPKPSSETTEENRDAR
jgi:uncharacterized membrane protein YdjX (TVP38/TMEM64 family)